VLISPRTDNVVRLAGPQQQPTVGDLFDFHLDRLGLRQKPTAARENQQEDMNKSISHEKFTSKTFTDPKYTPEKSPARGKAVPLAPERNRQSLAPSHICRNFHSAADK
jgi:hypothetical protein